MDKVWCWESGNSYKPYSADISRQLDELSVGGSFTTDFGQTSYIITKISNDKCEQKNTSTNRVRNGMRRNHNTSHDKSNRRRRDDSYHHDDEKEELFDICYVIQI